MCSTRGSLTVYFDDPFWVGVFEITMENMLSVAKITFGSEPKDAEVLEFVLKNYYALHFSPPTAVLVRQIPKNPKKAPAQHWQNAYKKRLRHKIATGAQAWL